MTIPVAPVNIHPTEAAPNQGQENFLRFLLAGAQGAARAQELQVEKERLKQQQAEYKSRLSENDAQRRLNEQLGEGMRNFLINVLQPSEGTGAAQQPLQTSPWGGNWQQGLPPQAGLPPGVPAQGGTPLGLPTPQGIDFGPGFLTALQQLPAGAVPAFVERTKDVRTLAEEHAQAAGRIKQFGDMLEGVTDPGIKEDLMQYFRAHETGLNIPLEAQKTMFPHLFGANGMDPQTINAAMNFMRTTGSTWGIARRAVGITQPVPGVPDSLLAPLKGPKPTTQQLATMGLLGALEREIPIMNATIEAAGGGIDLPASFFAQFRGNLPVAEVINKLNDPAQRQFLFSGLRAANAVRFAISGKQTTNQEFVDFLITRIPLKTDDPMTRQQKLATLETDREVLRDMTGGNAHPSVVLQKALRIAELQNWDPKIIDGYRKALADARAWEASSARRNRIYADDTPTTADSLDANMQQWDEWLRNNAPK